uniref:Roc domain-containing protein n=1 Tax=Arcella intermedia TaxID=1963864 RepID=A0A6B2LID2_9EUKA
MKEDDLEPEEKVKYVATFVGDSTAGKSALIQAILNKPFPEEHVPSSFETFDLEGKFSDEKLGNFNGPVEIWDSDVTQETKLYATFKASNVIVLCFSLVDYQSYLHLVKWKNLIESQVSPNIPVVLVGTKSDKLDSAQLARTGKSGFYSYSSANAYSKQLGCTNFLLTSAKNNDGIDEAWKEILKWKFFKYVPKPKEKGSLMDRLEKTKDNLLPYQK